MSDVSTLQSLIADRWVGSRAGTALSSAIDGSTIHHTHADEIDFGEALSHARKAGVPALMAMDSFTDIDGNSLLDNTVVAYVTEVARAWDHNQTNVPVVLFGGKNTKLKGGTFVKVTGGPLPIQTGPSSASSGSGNRPMNDVWLALAPVFGVTMSSLGSAAQFTGPLPGVFNP